MARLFFSTPIQGYNHVAGGLIFTGIFIGATVAASLLPDIDHTRSAIGKTFYPGSGLASTSLRPPYDYTFGLFLPRDGRTDVAYAVVTGYALLSHLLFDK